MLWMQIVTACTAFFNPLNDGWDRRKGSEMTEKALFKTRIIAQNSKSKQNGE